MNLADAQVARRTRADETLDRWIEDRLAVVGLSEHDSIQFGTADVSPAARKKLQPIINALRKDPHPFTRCMKNLREEQPGWSEDRRKKTCNVLKALAGRSNGGSTKASFSDTSSCLAIDTTVAALLDLVDDEGLAELEGIDAGIEGFAALTAKKRKSMPGKSFVFPKDKRYPIHDRAHAANALARSKGKPEEAAVRAAVCRSFPDLPACQKKGEKN